MVFEDKKYKNETLKVKFNFLSTFLTKKWWQTNKQTNRQTDKKSEKKHAIPIEGYISIPPNIICVFGARSTSYGWNDGLELSLSITFCLTSFTSLSLFLSTTCSSCSTSLTSRSLFVLSYYVLSDVSHVSSFALSYVLCYVSHVSFVLCYVRSVLCVSRVFRSVSDVQSYVYWRLLRSLLLSDTERKVH